MEPYVTAEPVFRPRSRAARPCTAPCSESSSRIGKRTVETSLLTLHLPSGTKTAGQVGRAMQVSRRRRQYWAAPREGPCSYRGDIGRVLLCICAHLVSKCVHSVYSRVHRVAHRGLGGIRRRFRVEGLASSFVVMCSVMSM